MTSLLFTVMMVLGGLLVVGAVLGVVVFVLVRSSRRTAADSCAGGRAPAGCGTPPAQQPSHQPAPQGQPAFQQPSFQQPSYPQPAFQQPGHRQPPPPIVGAHHYPSAESAGHPGPHSDAAGAPRSQP